MSPIPPADPVPGVVFRIPMRGYENVIGNQGIVVQAFRIPMRGYEAAIAAQYLAKGRFRIPMRGYEPIYRLSRDALRAFRIPMRGYERRPARGGGPVDGVPNPHEGL